MKISYTEVLKADSGLVSYTYPLNTEKFSSAPIHDVSIAVQLNSDRPLTSIYSPTQDVEIKRPDPNHAVVGYEAKDVRPDTDFQLFFAPQKEDVSLDLVTYRQNADDDGYFLLLASPGAKAKERHLPKDVVFVLDTSGSMADDNKLVQAKKALNFCLQNLNQDDHVPDPNVAGDRNEADRFEIIRFSTEPESLFGKLTTADLTTVPDAQKFVAKMRPSGGHGNLRRAPPGDGPAAPKKATGPSSSSSSPTACRPSARPTTTPSWPKPTRPRATAPASSASGSAPM